MKKSQGRTAENPDSATGMISVRGARVHNLKNVDLDIPRDKLVVITGVSGSGKSSLAFDTIFAEGQRRYLESLSTYTRQFLNQLERPDVDFVTGLPPTISIEQRAGSTQTRSTLATTTEIHDYLRLLFARAGTAHCSQCGQPVSRQSVESIVHRILALDAGRKVMILAPVVRGRKGKHRDTFAKISKDGFVRARVDGELIDIAEPPELNQSASHSIEIIVDRIIVKDGIEARLRESVDLAVKHGKGTCLITDQRDGEWHDQLHSTEFACADCGLSFPPLEPRSFSFNSPYGACENCGGLGETEVNADPEADSETLNTKRASAKKHDSLFQPCDNCNGARLNAFSRAVTVADRRIEDISRLSVAAAHDFFSSFGSRFLNKNDDDRTSTTAKSETEKISDGLNAQGKVISSTVPQIEQRLSFLIKVGLHYVTLDRPTHTLSGGEFQRTRLAACLGSGLTGVCYILDEPTLGLHATDVARLVETLTELRDQRNSLLVVEHDETVIRNADHVVEVGPRAGHEGGSIVCQGTVADISAADTATGQFLSTSQAAAFQGDTKSDDAQHWIEIKGAELNNLQKVNCRFPLGKLVCVTGVSGSGKSSLIMQTLVPFARRFLDDRKKKPTEFSHIVSDISGLDQIERLIQIDQSPIGKNGRSNPATYSGIWDEVRKLYAKTKSARLRGFTARRFSFNAKEGRCPECAGRGQQRIEMNFMPDFFVPCKVCRGRRFNRQTLAVRFRGHSVADALELRIDAAAELFERIPRIHNVLKTMSDVGLGYLALGQSALTLSGGESQRVKLATWLGKASHNHCLFVLDEPTSGLHAQDVQKLLDVLRRLIGAGHSVVVIEHNTAVMREADWLVDVGPGGGNAGGQILAQGQPGQVVLDTDTPTTRALRP